MEFFNVLIELSSLSGDIFQSLIVIAVTLSLKTYFTCYLELVKNIALAHFVRMKLEAERRDADLLQTLVNNIQSSLFLGCEKNLLTICKTVRDYGCDSL